MARIDLSHLQTEQAHPKAAGLDQLPGQDILGILLQGQLEAVKAIQSALPALEKGSEAMTRTIRNGGNLVYGAAGSSGMQALADGLEIPPTFGLSSSRIHILRAGGFDNMTIPKEGAEDDAEAATADARVIGPKDCVICLAASGNTIYPVTIMNIAQERGATVIGISNNPDARLLQADIPVYLPTGPEVIAGSTRLGAGTAQKIALNLMSSLMGIRLGQVVDGLMVNVATSNVKLRARATQIVVKIAGCTTEQAQEALERADWRAKEAIMIVHGARDLQDAEIKLEKADHNLRKAMSDLKPG